MRGGGRFASFRGLPPGGISASVCPSGVSGWTQRSFHMGNEHFFVVARKSKGCAEAYIGTPHISTG